MNGNYLIPANSKRSMLILSLFAPIDVAIGASGAVVTFMLLMVFGTHANGLLDLLLFSTPALVCALMIVPIPNHRNIWQLTVHIYIYLMSNKQYYWRGWCFNNGSSKK